MPEYDAEPKFLSVVPLYWRKPLHEMGLSRFVVQVDKKKKDKKT